MLRLHGDAGAKSCFAFGPKTKVGPLHKISLKTAKAAPTSMDQYIVPPTSMALRDFKVMTSVLFTTADACFPCWTRGNKEAVTTNTLCVIFLGLPSLADPLKWRLTKAGGRGRQRRLRARQFSAYSSSREAKTQTAKAKTTTRKHVNFPCPGSTLLCLP